MLLDLHTHTKASDGRLSAEELVERAVQFKLDVLAITDHDTISGLELAHQAIKARALPLVLINGIEISTLWQNMEIHIVGLNIDTRSLALKQLIDEQALKRMQRAEMIDKRLTKKRINGSLAGALAMAEGAAITRAHFARWMIEQGIAKTQQDVFKRYLGKGKQCYVAPQWCSMHEAIAVIHQAGGQAVLAHPSRYKLTTKWLKRLLEVFADAEGDAMEVAYPQQSMQERRLLTDYANHYQLLGSQGSDFHYPVAWIELGRNLYLFEDCTGVWSTWQQ